MKKYQVCICVTTTTRNFITIEADNAEAAETEALSTWYKDDRAFSSKLMNEIVEDSEVIEVKGE